MQPSSRARPLAAAPMKTSRNSTTTATTTITTQQPLSVDPAANASNLSQAPSSCTNLLAPALALGSAFTSRNLPSSLMPSSAASLQGNSMNQSPTQTLPQVSPPAVSSPNPSIPQHFSWTLSSFLTPGGVVSPGEAAAAAAAAVAAVAAAAGPAFATGSIPSASPILSLSQGVPLTAGTCNFAGFEAATTVGSQGGASGPAQGGAGPQASPMLAGARNVVGASRHMAAEQRRRARINERLDALRALVPHSARANTASFLTEVHNYILHLHMELDTVGEGQKPAKWYKTGYGAPNKGFVPAEAADWAADDAQMDAEKPPTGGSRSALLDQGLHGRLSEQHAPMGQHRENLEALHQDQEGSPKPLFDLNMEGEGEEGEDLAEQSLGMRNVNQGTVDAGESREDDQEEEEEEMADSEEERREEVEGRGDSGEHCNWVSVGQHKRQRIPMVHGPDQASAPSSPVGYRGKRVAEGAVQFLLREQPEGEAAELRRDENEQVETRLGLGPLLSRMGEELSPEGVSLAAGLSLGLHAAASPVKVKALTTGSSILAAEGNVPCLSTSNGGCCASGGRSTPVPTMTASSMSVASGLMGSPGPSLPHLAPSSGGCMVAGRESGASAFSPVREKVPTPKLKGSNVCHIGEAPADSAPQVQPISQRGACAGAVGPTAMTLPPVLHPATVAAAAAAAADAAVAAAAVRQWNVAAAVAQAQAHAAAQAHAHAQALVKAMAGVAGGGARCIGVPIRGGGKAATRAAATDGVVQPKRRRGRIPRSARQPTRVVVRPLAIKPQF